MRYVLAILFPPLAILGEGKVFQAILNIFLCLFFVIPGIIHALAVVHDAKNKERMNELSEALYDAIQQQQKKAL